MKGKFLTAFVLVLAISIGSLPLLAHHGNAVYDDTRTITLKGTVTQWLWANPHCILHLDVTDNSGQVVSWIVETENPTSMFNIGWTKTSFKPGDQDRHGLAGQEWQAYRAHRRRPAAQRPKADRKGTA